MRGKVKIPPEHSLARGLNAEMKMQDGETHALATIEQQANDFQ